MKKWIGQRNQSYDIPVRPARPALCLADAWDMGETMRESIPSLGLNTILHKFNSNHLW
jgi:hypothetical protein